MVAKKFRRSLFLQSLALALVISFLLAAVVAWQVDQNNKQYLDQRVDQEATALMRKIQERLALYQYGLRGIRAFVMAQEEEGRITRASYNNYAMTRDIAAEFPGARGFGFIRRVADSELNDYVRSIITQGYPTFSVRQLQPHQGEHYVIEMVEPVESNLAALGLDIASEIHRKTAAEAAIATGKVQLTAPITLVQATGKPQQSFLILMPVYKTWRTPELVSERWGQAIGWSYAPLLMTEILDSLAIDTSLFRVRLVDVKEPGNELEFYQRIFGKQMGKTQKVTQEVFGRTWQLELAATSDYAKLIENSSPLNTFYLVFLISLLASSLAIAVINSFRSRTELLKQSSHLAAVVETSNDAIVSEDTEGRIISWNRGATVMFGYSEEEVLGKKVMNVLIPEDLQEEASRLLQQLRQGKSENNLITRRQHKNGELLDVMVSVTPILKNNKVVGAAKTITNISTLKRTEQELKRLNANLESEVSVRTSALAKALRENEAILNVIDRQFLFSITDPRGNIIQVNENFCKASGYSEQVLLGENHRILNSGYHPRSFWTQMWSAIHSGESWREEVCNLSRDGSLRWFDTVIAPIMDDTNRVERILAIRSDITERKQTELQLSASKEQLAKASDVAQLGIWTWQVKSNLLEWNSQMFALYAQPESLAQGGLSYQHWRERLHPDDADQAEAELRMLLDGSGDFRTLFRLKLPNGDIRYVKTAAQVERNRFGKPERVTGINLDVTDQQNIERELRRAKELADKASESKSQFLANMSHEIRTPMNGVLGMLELVRRTQLTEQQSGYINNATLAAKSLLGILNDILDFSKISAGKMTLDPVEFSVEELLRQLAVILAGNHGQKPVEIILHKDKKLPDHLIGDRLRLLQIFINLAGNALKFTETGQVIVAINLVELYESELRLRFEVQDTGIGMTEAQLAGLFQSFSQAEASTTRRFGGTGLGLIISKRLVEMMGGQLNVESHHKVGSRFWFEIELPYNRNQSLLDGNAESVHQGKRVLVVDDHPMFVEILASGLSEDSYQVSKASSGVEAVQLVEALAAEQTYFDVILMDWNMPGMNGIEAGRKILAISKPVKVPQIIMITAYEKEMAEQIDVEGDKPFADVIVKPFTLQQVEETLDRCLYPKQLSLSAAPPVSKESDNRLKGFNILLVDDNDLNREIAFELLSTEGAKVSVATDGKQAVEKVIESNELFDLVLMDIQMPNMDGYEATRCIRADKRFTHLPIVAMTANASESDRDLCLQAGMNDHLAKPFDIHVLVNKIWALRGSTSNSLVEADDKKSISEVGTENLTNRVLIEPVAKILDRFNGNSDLAGRMCHRFRNEVAQSISKIEAASEKQDLDELTSCFHALKGISATLGASSLASFASLLEAQGRAGSAPRLDQLNQLKKLAELSVEAIDGLNFTYDDKFEKANLSQGELLSLLENLANDLRDSNMNAIRLSKALLAEFPDEQSAKTLCRQIEDLQFAEAEISLQSVRAKIIYV